ncbi:YbdK family carboxylate-amine ligase [Leucobacter viscericola]|uniref:Putative glutamate--cysteine ligase 2 n=1 Tax=Leucobacter viscericola TaxID=2714935 RepID=A0A6G7XE66_9MICO|nr:YbdK family carboxylate-amine ligase [Leucobacter viscericola]QIK62855.1 YbdK family carboxylate-amine ligase [Leucobacter viscericola]
MLDEQGNPRGFGIEEEYLLLDAKTGMPANGAEQVIRDVDSAAQPTEHEFLASQLETATPVCTTAEEAESSLRGFRDTVAQTAERQGMVLASSGLPPLGGDTEGTVTPKSRYQLIREEMRGVAAHQYAIGTHVHVAVPSRDAGVEVIDRISRWMPVLLALTANSPLWCGNDTGFASWRYIQGLMWPISGYPPSFADGAQYEDAVARLIDTGVLIDAGHLTWTARLSANYPTVEVRIADAQLEVGESVAFAVIVRALVNRALREIAESIPRPQLGPGIVDGAIWIAARNGLRSDLTDPVVADTVPAFTLVDRMIATVEEELQFSEEWDRVQQYLDGLRERGGPADRQLLAHENGGIDALLKLYRSGSHASR